MSTLDIRDLTVHIGESAVVSDVSFRLERGARVGLIGESGSGKSLTALAIMGLLPEEGRATGDIDLSGQSIGALSERRLARLRGSQMAMVFQEPMTALDPVMRAGRQVAEVIRQHRDVGRREANRAAVEMLRMVELPEPEAIAARYPHQLSGGQRQRVVLAMALANEPALLICDEPTTALDVTVQARMLGLISRLVSKRDTALLFISHDLAVVSDICESVLVMYGGRIVESGPVAEVFTAPRHPYTHGLLAASDLAEATPGAALRTIPGSVPGLGEFPVGCVFRNRCDRSLDGCAELPPLVATGERSLACINPVPTR
ncbi:MAG TPA: ABC transporter ATP-binding protein [Mycobacteriales bacterium]|jgi:peptide/nickel transport system ATP-binding protein|nr:ABC transporter ATP-binding protein [Mycobacteriales bacterium]